MATGIIESVTGSQNGLKSGTLKTDETNDILFFRDEPITCDVGDPVSFDIVIQSRQESLAQQLTCLSQIEDHPLSPITGAYQGDIEVRENQRLVIRGAGDVTGRIIIHGGKVRIANGGDVTGRIIIHKSGTLRMSNGTLNGDIDAQNAEIIRLSDGSKVIGRIIIHKGHRMVIEDSTIQGGLEVADTYRIAINSNAKITC